MSMSTFAGIEMGKRGLFSHQKSLSTVGHNLSNMATEGYSRQRVKLETFIPLYDPSLNRDILPGQIGQGVTVASVERIRDELLQNRIIAQGDNVGFWDTRDKYILMAEQVYNEPTEASIRTNLDKFWESLQELSIRPEERAVRLGVIERGENLIKTINHTYERFKEIRTMSNDDLIVSVGEVNSMLKQISDLNTQIAKVKAVGDNPNDLLDKRDLLIENLSHYLPVTVDNRDPDEFLIHTQGLHLIQGNRVSYLEGVPNAENESYIDVRWQHNQELVDLHSGKLASLVALRDQDLRGEIQKLDSMTMNFIDRINDVHTRAWGQDRENGLAFFVEYPFVNNLDGNYDRNGDGEFDSTYLFRMTGNNTLVLKDQIGLEGALQLSGPTGQNINIPYFPTDTVEDLMHRINYSGAEVVASLNADNQLTLKGVSTNAIQNPDFVIRHVEDSGDFLTRYAGLLVASGPEGAYRFDTPNAKNLLAENTQTAVSPLTHPSGWIGINEQIKNDPTRIAAGFGTVGNPAERGDGSAARAMSDLRTESVMIGHKTTFDDFFAETTSSIALRGETAQAMKDTHAWIMKDLKDTQQSISGVNMDEEFAQMIQYQHGYNAVARFITEYDKLIDTIINRLGV